MPYTIQNPPAFSKNMPKGAQQIAVDTANAVLGGGGKEEDAIRAAIANIKEKYRKVGDKWVPKAALVDITLTITKASLQPDGSMRWAAVTSDTDRDNTGEATSTVLFYDWIERASTGKSTPFLPPPRMPFLGVSHYPDLDGYGEGGTTDKMYVDGGQFKAAGTFNADHPVGKALFEAVRAEREKIKKGAAVPSPIRISAAWWDLCHQHGVFIFERKSLYDVCPMCAKGDTGKVYLKGQIDHWAATRVPINPRTAIGLEEKAMVKRVDDAASIIGEEQAAELERRAKLIGKSETEESDELPTGLVVRADDEPPTEDTPMPEKAATKTVDGKDYPASDFLVVENPKEPSTWHLQVKRDGKPDHTLMGGAWAALHEGHRGQKYEGPGKQDALDELKKMYAAEKMPMPMVKGDMEMDHGEEEDEGMELPFGGATTLAEAEAYIDGQVTAGQVYSNWAMLQTVVNNIFNQARPEELKARLQTAMAEFGARIDALKAAVSDAYLIEDLPLPEGEITMPTETTSHPVDVFKAAVEAALGDTGLGRDKKLQAIQEAMGTMVVAVKAQVDAVAPPDQAELINQAVKAAVAPLAEQVGLLLARGQQPAAPAQAPQQKSFMPTQRAAVGQPEVSVSPITGQPSSLTAAIRRSVGIV